VGPIYGLSTNGIALFIGPWNLDPDFKLSLKGKWVHTPKLPQVGIQNPDVEGGGGGWPAFFIFFVFSSN